MLRNEERTRADILLTKVSSDPELLAKVCPTPPQPHFSTHHSLLSHQISSFLCSITSARRRGFTSTIATQDSHISSSGILCVSSFVTLCRTFATAVATLSASRWSYVSSRSLYVIQSWIGDHMYALHYSRRIHSGKDPRQRFASVNTHNYSLHPRALTIT